MRLIDRPFVPIEPKPCQIFNQLPIRALFDSRSIDIFNAQNDLPSVLAGVQPIGQKRSRVPEVKCSSGRWGKTGDMLRHRRRDHLKTLFAIGVGVGLYLKPYYSKRGMKGSPMARPSTGTNLSLSALQSIIESRRSELNKLRKARTRLQRDLDAVDRQIGKIEGGGGRGGSGRVRNAASLPEMIDKVMRESGKPMKVGEIVNAVEAAGYRSSSPNFRGIVNQTLIKEKKRFVAPERGLYVIKK
jgi:hypothetical protein